MYPRKYVIVEVNEVEVVILFDSILEHREFCNCNRHPLGAGFYNAYVENGELQVVCYGRSETLRCESRQEVDAELIKNHFMRGM